MELKQPILQHKHADTETMHPNTLCVDTKSLGMDLTVCKAFDLASDHLVPSTIYKGFKSTAYRCSSLCQHASFAMSAGWAGL